MVRPQFTPQQRAFFVSDLCICIGPYMFNHLEVGASQISHESVKSILCSQKLTDFESAGVKLIEKACFSTIHVYFRVNANIMKDIGHLVSVTFFLRHSVLLRKYSSESWKIAEA